ncbi:MAG: helix-turn-helix domain-containing protein [Anaerolineae bacterium]|nr:helix-turn-helix domain-containing protein [Anaerolineae bacterium]
MKDIHEVMLNPVRMRIIQVLAVTAGMTTAELAEKINDVPRTTLYRHVRVLVDHGIVSVIAETRIRGSLERTLALNMAEVRKSSQLEDAPRQVLAFLMERYARFHSYFTGAHPDPGRDRIFWNTTVMMMDDAEFDAFLTELRGLLIKYTLEAGHGRKARDITVISAPT